MVRIAQEIWSSDGRAGAGGQIRGRGFPLSEVIAWAWKRGGEKLKDQPGFAEVFMPEGRAPGKRVSQSGIGENSSNSGT